MTGPATARAQSPQWTAHVVVQPFPSPFIADWERNPQMAMLTLLYTGTAPQDYHIEGFVRSPERGEIVRVTSPQLSLNFGPVSQVYTGADVLEWQTISRDRQYTDIVLRTGVMPEGTLEMCARVVSSGGAQLAEACSDFTVSLPEPPQLLFPANGATVLGAQPVLQWTPVLLPPAMGVSYHVKVVRRDPQQSPATALAANPVWLETDVTGPPMLVYPTDALPLEANTEYAWQVEVRDGDGRPVTRGGRGSEMWTFMVGGPSREGPLATGSLPDTLMLIPGVARLTGLRSADVTSNPFGYTLNGRVDLQIESPFQATVRVDAQDLEIDRNALTAGVALVRGGTLAGSVPAGVVPEALGGRYLRFSRLSYSPAAGLALEARLELPGTSPLQLTGALQVTGGGLFGEVAAEGAAGAPLFAYGQDPVRLQVRRVRVTLPAGAIALDGGLELFARDLGCANVSATVTGAGVLNASAGCTPSTPLGLGGAADRTQVALRSVTGALSLDFASGAFTYDLSASGELRLDVGAAGGAGANCGGGLSLRIHDGQVEAGAFTPRCDAGEGESDMGWLKARLSSLALHRFAYVPGRGFDFELAVDLQPSLPAVPGFELPGLTSVLITQNGIAIPAVDVAITRPPFTLAGFGVKVSRVRLPAFTLSWNDWQLRSPNGFRFSFDAEITLPELPPGAPSCLTSQPIQLTGAELSNGKFRMTLAERRFTPACGITLTAPAAPGGDSTGRGTAAGGGPSGGAPSGGVSGGGPSGGGTSGSADPYAAVTEPQAPAGQALPGDTQAQWPADPAQARQQFEAERGRIVTMEDSLRAQMNNPRCSDRCVDSLRLRRQAVEDSMTQRWDERDFGAIRAVQARCLGQERQRQLLGTADTTNTAAIGCLSGGFARADSILSNIRSRLDSSATCQATYGYYARATLGIERQRQLLGAASENSSSLSDVMASAAPCERAIQQRLAQTCASRPTLRLMQNDVAAILGIERQHQLLGDTTTGIRLDSLEGLANSCTLNPEPIVPPSGGASASGRAPPGTLAWSGVPPLAEGRGGAGPSAGEPALEAVAAEPPHAAWASSQSMAIQDTAAVPPTSGVRLELERIGGELVVGISPFFMVEKVPEIDGNLVLPSLFQCADSSARRQPLLTRLRFGPHGEVNGTVTGLAPSCPIDLAAVRITVTEASLTFSTAQGSQSAVLRARASAQFTLAGDSVTGTGAVAVDLLHGRLLGGSLAFQGPFRFDLPRENRVLSFVLQSAALDSAGIHVDGRASLTIADSQTVGVTFDHVTINPQTVALSGGRVLFDVPFGFEVGIAQAGGLTWRAVARGAPIALASGLRVDLPSRIVLDSAGFGVSGDGSARIVYEGRDVDSLSAVFSSDFALSLGPPGVRRGNVALRLGAASLATIDALGFHPNLAYFATALLPARLPLPTETAAYLQLRDTSGNLLVGSENTGSGVRLFTRPGVPISLVVPALQMGRPTAPRVGVTFDVTLDPLGTGIALGSIGVALSPSDRAAFDLSALGIPFAIDTLAFDRGPTGAYRIALGGALTLFGGRQAGGADARVVLTVDGAGTLAGDVRVVTTQTIPLMQGSQKVTLAVDSIVGSFNAALATGGVTFRLAVSGGLALEVSSTEHYRADATLEVSDQGVRATGVRFVGSDAPKYLDLGVVRLGVNNLRVPRLSWTQADGFQFEILLDALLSFPTLRNLTLPPVRDIALRNDGFTIPAYEIPEIHLGGTGGATADDTIRVGGLTITPLAFRMGEIRYNWFTGQGPADWGFGFDVEVGLGDLGPDAPAALRGLHLRLLNAGMRNGQLYGSLEPVRFAQPIDVGFGKLAAVWGRLAPAAAPAAPADTAPVFAAEFNVDVASHLPFCEAAVHAAGDTIAIYADGSIAGHITDLTSTCSGSAGPLHFTFAATDLLFAGGPRGRRAELAVRGSVSLPGTDGSPVTVQGDLRADLLTGRMIAGSIAIDRPFRWTPPDSNPYLSFDVQHASLDSAGLHFTGGGSLRLADGATVGVTFNDLVLGIPDLRLKNGSVTLLSQFALGVGIGSDGQMHFGAQSLSAPRPAGSSFRVVLPPSITLDANGLHLAGTASASLAFADKEFATIQVAFTNGFAVGFQPVKVSAGRADFILNGDSIAHVDAGGFWPGNIFGVLPVPRRLGLPSEDVAYVELRDTTGALLIETASDPSGIRLRTRVGAAVRLVMPALASGGITPSANVTFDIVVNPSTFQLVSGGVTAENLAPGGLFSLDGAGIPLEIRRIGFESSGPAYALHLAARLRLPASLSGADLVLNDLTITPQGLSGSVDLGTYKETYDAALVPVKSVAIGSDLTVDFTGVRVTFGTTTDVRLAGALKSPLFAPQGGNPVPLFFTARLATTTGLTITVDPGLLTGPVLPILVATFQPQSLGGQPAIQVRASATEFAVRLSGILRVPSLSPGLAVTVDGLEVGTAGVTVPTISISTGGQLQQFNLFGATLTLRDSTAGGTVVYPAVGGTYSAGTLSLTLSGSLAFMDNTARFYGLTVTSAGSVTLAAANLLSQPISIVQNVLTLNQLSVHSNRLRADVGITLPAPLNSGGPQQAFFEVGTDGTISGGANLVLIQEAAGLNPSSATQLNVGVATIHLRYLGLTLDFADLRRNSSVTLVADAYIQNSADNRIQLGDVVGGVVQPGLRVGFDGTVQWGNLRLAREFSFDFQAVKLKITSVSFPAQQTGFAIGLSGELSLNLASVTGALAFQDFTITSQGQVLFSPSGITGGEIAIANVVRLSVTGFGFSATPTSIEIQGGGMPTTGQAASPATQTILVDSYIRFGGTISVADVFSGGVQEFLLYRTPDQLSHLIIRHAALAIQNVLTFNADFRYDQNPSGFEMVMGAQGHLMGAYTVTLVGVIAKEQQTTRVGIFLAAGGLTIPVPGVPIIVITDLGGGFFLNPKQEYLDLVRSYAGVSQTAGRKIVAPTGDFAVLLFGGVSIVRPQLMNGRILLTIMNTAIQIDGALTVLDQGNRFQGDAHLVIGLQQAFAEGNVSLAIDYSGVVKGGGSLDFWVYGGDNWGVRGTADFKIVAMIDAGGKLFIGPPGFVLSAHMKGGFDIWIVSISGFFDGTIWYKSSVNEWGAYVEIGVEASVAGGLATARGTLLGGLVIQQTVFLFAAAELEVQVVGLSWKGVVWVKLDNGQTASGFGSDAAMQAVIDAAHTVADEMLAAKDQATAAIDSARAVVPAAAALTTAELAQTYNAIQTWSATSWTVAYWTLIAIEMQAAVQPGEGTYESWYSDALRRVGLPGDSGLVANNTDAVTRVFQSIEADRPAVQARIAALRMGLAPVVPGAAAPTVTNPVTSLSLDAPVATERVNADGRTEKVVTSAPGFEIDVSRARAAQVALGALRTQAGALDQQVREGIVALEAGLATVRAATTSQDAAALPAFARHYADVTGSAEQQFAAQADLILMRQDWTRSKLGQLYARDTTATRWITDKTAALTGANTNAALIQLMGLASLRTRALSGMSANPALHAQFVIDSTNVMHNTDRSVRFPYFAGQANSAGRQIWYEIARVGMEASAAQADLEFPRLQTTAATRLAAIQAAHQGLSSSLSSLYEVQAAATGTLYDLYDRYYFWRAGTAASTSSSTTSALVLARAGGSPVTRVSLASGPPGPPTADMLTDTVFLRNRLQSLGQDLTPPRLNSVQVSVVTADRYTAQLQFSWSAWHPSGAYEFEYRDVNGTNQPLGDGFLSSGSQAAVSSSRFTPNRSAASTVTRTFQAAARGGAGFAGFGRANYTLSFGTVAGAPASVSGGTLLPDVTPPSAPVVYFPSLRIERGVEPHSWTGDPNQVAVEWSASDAESGVAEYEYALWGTRSGHAEGLIALDRGQGPPSTEIRPFTSARGRTTITLDGLNLQPGTPLYVAVRAKNPGGLVSPVGVSAALRYDPTPPVFATGAAIQPTLSALMMMFTTWQPLAPECTLPLPVPLETATGGLVWRGTLGGAAPPPPYGSATFNRPTATDGESGIADYYFTVSAQPDSNFSPSRWVGQGSSANLVFSGQPLDYQNPFYITMVAVNGAGLASVPLTYGPFRISDPTPPTAPAFCASLAGTRDRFVVPFSTESTDPETGVVGYQYRVRTAAGATVRDWPASGVDWSPGAGTRTTAALALTEGQGYIVDVRAKNGHGLFSAPMGSGPVTVPIVLRLDVTPLSTGRTVMRRIP